MVELAQILPGPQLYIAFFMLVCFIIAGCGVMIFFMRRMMWPFTYIVMENIPGSGTIPTMKGRCRMIGFGDGGEEIFFLKNLKKWRIAYGKRIGPRQICWTIGEDGYWYNNTFGNLDKKLREVGVIPVDRDLRYAYASARKGIENRYNEKTFIEKYGALIAMGMLFLCIVAFGIVLWYVFKQTGAMNAQFAHTAEILGKAIQAQANAGVGNSGLLPA